MEDKAKNLGDNMDHTISFLVVTDFVLRKAEGEIRHGLFVVVHSRSSSAQIESTLFAASHLFSLFIPRVAPFVATFYYEELRSHEAG